LIDINLLHVVQEKIFKNFSVFLLFRYYLPLEKEVTLHMNNSESLLFKDDFKPTLVTIGPVVPEKK
jgi:hypothetical protein